MPELITSISLAQQRIIEQGSEVGVLARQQFPEGMLIGGKNSRDAVRQTQTAIEGGHTCLFEAAFLFDNLLVRCDLLQKQASGAWDIIEVKSSTDVKEDHLHELAFQLYVVTGQGLPVQHTHLMHINRNCVAPDLSNLFLTEETTSEGNALLPNIPERVTSFRTILTQDTELDIPISKACIKPHPCPITHYCWRDVPEHSVFTIPRLSDTKLDDLVEQGLLSVFDLPAAYPLSAKQRAYVDAVMENRPSIDADSIRNALSKLDYPIHFLDFETVNPAVPRFDGLRPYNQIPFQYSCHLLQRDGKLLHREYLHTDTSDPRLPLLQSLLSHIAGSGSVVAYNTSFEKQILKSLVATFPEYAPAIRSIIDRLWDQLAIFNKHYLHPDFLGSNSIKSVLPVLVPSLSYQKLGVQKGDDAQAVWETMIQMTDGLQKQKMIADLKAYCHLDTLAMVEIHRALQKI